MEEREATGTTAEPTPVADERDRVSEWRLDQFQRLGFSSNLAITLTESEVELAGARRLIARGCPPATAAEILL